jgi:hypothetical protein
VYGVETDCVQSGKLNGLTSPAGYTIASIDDLVYPTQSRPKTKGEFIWIRTLLVER